VNYDVLFAARLGERFPDFLSVVFFKEGRSWTHGHALSALYAGAFVHRRQESWADYRIETAPLLAEVLYTLYFFAHPYAPVAQYALF
jgi:hypothetical protein